MTAALARALADLDAAADRVERRIVSKPMPIRDHVARLPELIGVSPEMAADPSPEAQAVRLQRIENALQAEERRAAGLGDNRYDWRRDVDLKQAHRIERERAEGENLMTKFRKGDVVAVEAVVRHDYREKDGQVFVQCDHSTLIVDCEKVQLLRPRLDVGDKVIVDGDAEFVGEVRAIDDGMVWLRLVDRESKFITEHISKLERITDLEPASEPEPARDPLTIEPVTTQVRMPVAPELTGGGE